MKIKNMVIAIIALVLIAVAAVFFTMVQEINKLEKLDYTSIKIENLTDGTYQGSASAVLVSAKVEVTIRNGRIEKINLLEHNHGPNYGADKLIDAIGEANSLEVDGISGATASSTVVKAAVFEALKKGVTP